MIRLIVQITDVGDAANVGGPVLVRYRTFDVDLPAVEAELRKEDNWMSRLIVGAELLEPSPAAAPGAKP